MARRASRPAAPSGSAYDAAVRYLGARNRSVAEIRRHLRGKRFDDAVIDAAIDKLRAQRYVDDGAFARYWVEQRDTHRPRGERALVSELMQKGLSREVIELALGEREPDADVKRARELIKRPITRWMTLSDVDRKRKIHQYLAQRGFSYEVIDEVIEHPRADEE
jgi:regulatory protein